MAQPADYLRLQGPLGGANFLNTSDYARGAQTAMMPVNQVMDVAQQGAQIGQTIQQARALGQQTNERQAAAANAESQKKAQIEALRWASSALMGSAQPQAQAQSAPVTQQQTPTPMGAAPVTGIQGGARTAPVAPQGVPQQSAPQQAVMPPTSSAPQPAPVQAQVQQSAPQQPVMPPTTAQQATQQPVPQSAAAQTGSQAVQPPTLSQRVQNVGGEIQRISQTHDAMMSKLYGDVQAGRISPEAALLVEQGLINKRNSDADRIIKYEKDIAEIADKYAKSDKSEAETRKARIEAAKATVEFEDSGYYQVKKTFETMGPEMAVAEAASLGLDPSKIITEDGKLSPVVEKRANRSPEAREERKAAAEEAKANAIKWTFDKDLGVSTGVDKDGRVMIKDSEGNTMTSAEFRALGVNQKERVARAGRAVTQVSAPSSANIPTEPGKLSGLERDRQGNITLSKDITDGLRDAARQFTNAERGLRELATIEKENYIQKASASGAGALVVSGQRFMGYEGDMRKASEALDRFANSALGIIESPLMKGAPSEADARRALSVINDPASSVETKKEAIGQLKAALEEARTRYRESIDQFDTPTRQRLKASGLPIPSITPAEFDAKWAKLPSGGSLVGPDGITYVKR